MRSGSRSSSCSSSSSRPRADFLLTPVNLSNILLAAAVVGVVACAQTLLLVAGQVDISVGSAVAFASAVFAVSAPSYGIPVAIVACIGAALVVAAVNVVGIVHFRVSSIIVTLATFIMFRGLARIVLDGRAIQVHDFGLLGQTKFAIFGIDVHLAIVVLLAVAVVFYLLMSGTQYGQHMYAIGANSRAARLAGIPLERHIVVAFVLSAMTVAVASLLLTSQTGVVDPTTGERLEFLALTGVMIGGRQPPRWPRIGHGHPHGHRHPGRVRQRARAHAGALVLPGGLPRWPSARCGHLR